MPLVPLRRPSQIIRNVIEEHRRWGKATLDNIDRINNRFAVTENVTLDHGVQTSVTSPFRDTGVVVKAIEAVYCVGVNTTTGATYTTLGIPRIDWQPSDTSDDMVLVTASFPAPSGMAVLHKSANQTLTTGNSAPVTFNVNGTISGDLSHSTSSNTDQVVCNRAGFVEAFYEVTYAANATGQRLSWIGKNDTGTSALGRRGTLRFDTNASGMFQASASGIWEVDAGDYINLIANQSSGGDLDVVGAGATATNSTRFQVRYCAGPTTCRGRVTLRFLGG